MEIQKINEANQIFLPIFKPNARNGLIEHQDCSNSRFNRFEQSVYDTQAYITYKIGELEGSERINLSHDIYNHFSQKIKKNPCDIIITINKQVISRGLNFYQNQNEINSGAFIIYEIETLLKLLEQAELQNQKQQKLINFFLQTYGITLDWEESTIQSSSSAPQNITKIKLEQQKEVEQIFESETNSKMDSLLKLIQHKKIEVENLQTIHLNQKFNSCISQYSVIKEIYSVCSYCNLQIETNSLQTPCQHNYHKDCFDAMVQSDLYSKKCYLECICSKKIPVKCMQQFIQNQYQAELYTQQFLQNQIDKIKEKYPNMFRSCITNCCPFYFVLQSNLNKKHYCPLCLI